MLSGHHAATSSDLHRCLTQNFHDKSRALAQLADKAAWLRNWLGKTISRSLNQWSEPGRLAAERVDTWLNAYSSPSANYSENGGFRTWDAQRGALGLPDSDAQVNSESYSRDYASTTWVDYFTLDDGAHETSQDAEKSKNKEEENEAGEPAGTAKEKSTGEEKSVQRTEGSQAPVMKLERDLLVALVQDVHSVRRRDASLLKRKRPGAGEEPASRTERSVAHELDPIQGDLSMLTLESCKSTIPGWMSQITELESLRKQARTSRIQGMSLDALQIECRRLSIKFNPKDKQKVVSEKLLNHYNGNRTENARLSANASRSLPVEMTAIAAELNGTVAGLRRVTSSWSCHSRVAALGFDEPLRDGSHPPMTCVGCQSTVCYVLAACGHQVCSTCMPQVRENGRCVDAMCGWFVDERPILKLPMRDGGADKIDAVLDQIAKVPAGDRIVVFVQYSALCDALSQALEEKLGRHGYTNLVSSSSNKKGHLRGPGAFQERQRRKSPAHGDRQRDERRRQYYHCKSRYVCDSRT